ncbi:MAG: hypothetical protein KGZ25_11785 [Planctomycetes bacterium]|nr:hypothetical protein [Planctomycetota bacterium]
MAAMSWKIKTFYILACVLLLVAIVCEVVAMKAASEGAKTVAVSTSGERQTDEEVRGKSNRLARTSDRFSTVGSVFAFLGLTFWICARARGCPWTAVIPITLLLVYGALFLVLV